MPEIGIIGMGDMGKMYAKRLSNSGYTINACDVLSKYDGLRLEFRDTVNINILSDGHYVSRRSDYIIYSVEAEHIERIVSQYGPSTKMGAVVGGQTSCKAPEMSAFEKYLPADVDIISCHSLHGPGVNPAGQPLVIIRHRASDESFQMVKSVLRTFESKIVELSAAEHDRITADTQAVTHAAFLSMGVAWHSSQQFPWEESRWVGGIENVKINIALRILSNKWHVYAGLAILNPAAHKQIKQYAASVTELYKLILEGRKTQFEARIRAAGDAVFGSLKEEHQELLLQDDVLDRFSLSSIPAGQRIPNSHLSLLGMVDCWHKMGIVPYDHMICSTPLFRLWLGVTEYLFRQPALLTETINAALEDDKFRSDDLEFTIAARGWSDIVNYKDFQSYKKRFENVQAYFEPRFVEATALGNEMIRTIFERTKLKP
ncbi:Prephenate dehydrogenase [Taphrina deformans PYCC 5710]|uniref:Prephenate dehydrogenase [NADP(+)] n=1 Tax=Taphrina deformans (strain PYCC 5710 / ATCC 11124 / CBS 356.35 / IMI 108563 / JCM 9778 / NBRC 8474) TaxID=1097556 RepID=R4X829_TAPDE|nr:Prephenate dehydrogenase [Taphrina deformans PYCC 5710]|eukprot:CCG81614.1 Prephenate dehydrogenase [Taphrina deformans PYCC 5710]